MTSQRLTALWERHQVAGARAAASGLYRELAARYGESHRRYHTAAHIEHCLAQLDLAGDSVPNRDAVEMALWFHDAVYDPRASDNESRSAELFRTQAEGELRPSFATDVQRLIMVTEHGRRPPRRVDEEYVVDVDLSSFGMPWARFRHDSHNVRAEFPHLSDTEFAPNQRRFLHALLDRERIYSTDFFCRRLESRARDNISRYLATLSVTAAGSP